MNTKRGYTLIESLIAITLVSVTLAIVAVSLHGLSRLERHVRDGRDYDAAVDRFVAQLRADAHQAASAKIDGDTGKRLTLEFESGAGVEYSLHATELVRIATAAEVPAHRESYAVITTAAARWQIDSTGVKPVVKLSLPIAVGTTQHSPPEMQFQFAMLKHRK